MVMNLVLFAWFVSTDAFGGMSAIELKDLLYSEKLKEMEEDSLPFPILTNNNASENSSVRHYETQIRDLQEWNML
jgi:hypothetical protein